jgi:hypothetical protein
MAFGSRQRAGSKRRAPASCTAISLRVVSSWRQSRHSCAAVSWRHGGVAHEPALDPAIGGLHLARELCTVVHFPAREHGGAPCELKRLPYPRRQLAVLPDAMAPALLLHERDKWLDAPTQALDRGAVQEGALHHMQRVLIAVGPKRWDRVPSDALHPH